MFAEYKSGGRAEGRGLQQAVAANKAPFVFPPYDNVMTDCEPNAFVKHMLVVSVRDLPISNKIMGIHARRYMYVV